MLIVRPRIELSGLKETFQFGKRGEVLLATGRTLGLDQASQIENRKNAAERCLIPDERQFRGKTPWPRMERGKRGGETLQVRLPRE